MNTDTKKNYRTLTKCDSGKLYKVIEYNSTPGDMYWISKAMNDQNIFELRILYFQQD